MLNYIWAGMILLGVIYGVCTGQMSALTGGALDSAREAVSLCITMAGVMALWMGLMEIAQESGMIAKMTKGIRPFLKFMFPRLPEDHPAGEYITTNLIANVLGLGWACTPAGLKAMEQLAELEKQRAEQRRIEQQRMQPVNRQLRPVAGQGTEKGRQGSEDRRYGAEATAASNEMCTFLILNISSLQLIPVNMIAYRSQYGSANPAVIIAPALVATLFSTIIAIIYCKWKVRIMMNTLTHMSDIMIPMVIFWIVGYGMVSGVKVYETFLKGAKEGLRIVVEILPTLVGLMMAVGILRTSGFFDLLGHLIGPATQAVGLPAQLIPLLIVKMFSSSAATGLVLDIFKTCGPDSYAGMLTSILMSCTETIFYTMSVYFPAAKVTKTRYTLPGALLATLAGTVASIFLAGKM